MPGNRPPGKLSRRQTPGRRIDSEGGDGKAALPGDAAFPAALEPLARCCIMRGTNKGVNEKEQKYRPHYTGRTAAGRQRHPWRPQIEKTAHLEGSAGLGRDIYSDDKEIF